MATAPVSYTRRWAESHNKLAKTKELLRKEIEGDNKYGALTHTLLDGGVIGNFTSKKDYLQLYVEVSRDVVVNGGRIAIAEMFPPIFGKWPSFLNEPKHKKKKRKTASEIRSGTPPPLTEVSNEKKPENVSKIQTSGIPRGDESQIALERFSGMEESEKQETPLMSSQKAKSVKKRKNKPTWLLPPHHLMLYAFSVFNFPNKTDISQVSLFLKEDEDQRLADYHNSDGIDWTHCIFVMDLDYGPMIHGWYSEVEIVRDVHLVQEILKECGVLPDHLFCYVAIADQLGTLGVHLYFPFTKLTPPQCLALATLILHRFKARRGASSHLKNERTWEKIIDLGIYSSSLRLPFVCKAKPCPKCSAERKNEKKKKRPDAKKGASGSVAYQGCYECGGRGYLYLDRRYWVRLILKPTGHLSLSEMVGPYIVYKHFHPGPQDPNRKALLLSVIEDDETNKEHKQKAQSKKWDETQIREFVWYILHMLSLRVTCFEKETPLQLPLDAPRPVYLSRWTQFFQSVVDVVVAFQVANFPSTPSSKKEEKEQQPQSQQAIDPYHIATFRTSPCFGPGGIWAAKGEEDDSNSSFSSSSSSEVLTLSKQQERQRIKYGHMIASDALLSPTMLQEAQLMTVGFYKEFKKCQTIQDPKSEQIRLIQEYIRSETDPEGHYQNLMVNKINISEKNGSSLIVVSGEGQHYCRLPVNTPPRTHSKNRIFFVVDRYTGHLYQRCHSADCRTRSLDYGLIKYEDVRLLFTPLEVKTRAVISEEQKKKADEVMASFKSLAKPLPRKSVLSRAKQQLQQTGGKKQQQPSEKMTIVAFVPPPSPTAVSPSLRRLQHNSGLDFSEPPASPPKPPPQINRWNESDLLQHRVHTANFTSLVSPRVFLKEKSSEKEAQTAAKSILQLILDRVVSRPFKIPPTSGDSQITSHTQTLLAKPAWLFSMHQF